MYAPRTVFYEWDHLLGAPYADIIGVIRQKNLLFATLFTAV